MAGARLSIKVRPQRQFANAGSSFSPLHQLLQANFAWGLQGVWLRRERHFPEMPENAACTRCWRTLNCTMFGVTTSDDYQPVTWVGRHPVHVPLLLVAVHVFLMVVACLLSAFGAAGVLGLFIFDSAQVLGLGRVWQIVTYAFVHLPYSGMALLWFAVEMYM